jgi:RimJ/RimL family protein N-acetyltransferase
MTVPEILTPRLRLRGFEATDAEAMHHLMAEEGVLRYFPSTKAPSLERVRSMIVWFQNHWQQRGYGDWVVETRESGEVMGRCGLLYIQDTAETEIDFLLGKPFWGQGFATEAAKAALQFGLEEHNFAAVVGIVHPENLASQRVLEKLGMRQTMRTNYFGMDCFRYEIARGTPEHTAT